MSEARHAKQTIAEGIHGVISYEYANAAARLAATGFDAGDKYKTALQLDDGSRWVLTSIAPIIWVDWSTINWDGVAAALGGEAGVNANYVFKSDGAGSGTMGKNTQVIARRLTVGLSGDVDYNSIATAITAAITGGASLATPWEVYVHPGTYSEPPMILQPGISVTTASFDTVNITAQNPSEDLFSGTGGYLFGFRLSGVSDPAKCLIRCDGYGSTFVGHSLSFSNCSNGIIVSDGATVSLLHLLIIITAVGQAITIPVLATGTDSHLAMFGGGIIVLDAVLPSYAINPIQTAVKATDDATVFVSSYTFKIPYKDSTAIAAYCEDGARLSLMSCEFQDCNIATYIGSLGANSEVIVQGGTFINNVYNEKNESSTGLFFVSLYCDDFGYSGVPGSILSGFLQENHAGSYIVGPTTYRYTTNKELDLADYFNDFTSTGICEGNPATIGSGLNVNIYDGEGFISRLTPDEDAFLVSWLADSVSVAPNSTEYVVYDSVTELLAASASPPGQEQILLATAITDGYNVKHLHQTRVPVDRVEQRLSEYLVRTRRIVLNTGLAVTQGTSELNFNIDAGSYYRALDLISYAGVLDGYFISYYGTGSVNEEPITNEIDITNYDKAGVLTAMAPDGYRSDTVIITSDGYVSVIYGNAEFALATAAVEEGTAVIPSFLEPTGCYVAKLIIRQGVGIHLIIDARPTATWTAGGGASISVHSALAGLTIGNDHPQYLLVSGLTPMSGSFNMGGHNIINVGTVDGVVVSAHASRHNPGGLDPLATGTPVAVLVGAVANPGAAASFPKSDHQHGVAAGVAPLSIGAENLEGTSSSVARADHIHANASKIFNNTGDTLLKGRAVAVTGWYLLGDCPTVNYADKDIPALRPALGILSTDVSDSDFGLAILSGRIEGLDTTAWGITDQLVLGNDGYLVRPPPDTSPFTGEIQNIGQATKIDALDGHIFVTMGGQFPVTADQIFALEGTSGTPGPANHYVTDSDLRNTNDRTASGLRTASTIVVISGATAPTAGQTLIASSAVLATWQTPLQLTISAPQTVNTTNSVGDATTAARANHVHAHGNQTVGTLHALATTTVSGFAPAQGTTANTYLKTDGAGNMSWGPISPSNYQYSADETTTANATAVYANKLSVTTAALTGTYRISFYCEISHTANVNRRAIARLYNSTDAVELCLTEAREGAINMWHHADGFINIVFTGAAKTFIIQWASPDTGNVDCRRARFELWRVS